MTRALLLLALLPTLSSAQAPGRKIEGEIAGSYFFGNTRQTVASTRAQFERSDSGSTFRTMARFNYGELTQDLVGTTVNKRSWEAGANYDLRPHADFTPFVKALVASSLVGRAHGAAGASGRSRNRTTTPSRPSTR